MEVVYKLWEQSWEDDAVVNDKQRGVYAEPSRIHPINHEQILQSAGFPPERALAAAHASAVPGRHLAARHRVRGQACRMHLRERPKQRW
jgi:hypothetical protein